VETLAPPGPYEDYWKGNACREYPACVSFPKKLLAVSSWLTLRQEEEQELNAKS
jgi:hypothetical protein